MASTPPPPPNASPNAKPTGSPTSPPPLTTTTPSPQAASPPPQPDVNPPSSSATPPQSSLPQSSPPPVPAASPPINLSPPSSSPPSNVTPPLPPPQPVSPPPLPPPPPLPSNEAPPPTPIIPPPPPNEALPPTPIIPPPSPNDPPPIVLPPPSVPPVASPPPPITTPPPSVPLAPVNSPPPPVKLPLPPLTRPTSSPPLPPISPENSPPPSSLSPSNPPATSRSPPSPSSPNTLSPPPPSVPQKSPPPPVPTPPNDPLPPASRPTLSPPSNPSPPQQVVSPPPPANSSSPPSSLPSTSGSNNGIGTFSVVAIGVAMAILVISLIGFAIWCCKRRGKKGFQSSKGHMMPAPSASSAGTDSTVIKIQYSAPFVSSSGSDFVYMAQEQGGLGNSRTWFSYDELDKATNGFSLENLLGEGGFGFVYKGCLLDGKEIAVKVLKVGQGHGEREFKAEVEILSRIHHRNLVSLVGCCTTDEQKLLVYDYVPNKTLYFHLHGDGRPALDWATRVKIAAGAARGIAYLHEDCHPRIIHRDIKSSNILLDNKFEARVSDFGLAKLTQDAHTHITTRVMGTFGYMAPEYALSGKLTEKADVYSFGVVLLELITGRKPVDAFQPVGNESLVEWARPLLNHALNNEEFEGLADLRLEKNYSESEMFRMIEAATACVRHTAAKRPRMGQIARAFDEMTARDLTNGMRFGESEEFNTAQQSLEPRLFRRMQFGSKDNSSTENFSRSSTEYFSQNNTEYFSQSNTENFSQTSFDSLK